MELPECYSKLPQEFKYTENEKLMAMGLLFIQYIIQENKPVIYLAQSITTDSSNPYWTLDLCKKYGSSHTIVNPTMIMYRYPESVPTSLRVKTDIFMCSLADYILFDLTKGPSIGATVEVTMSKIMGKEIIGVYDSNRQFYLKQRISFFADFLCTRIQDYSKEITLEGSNIFSNSTTQLKPFSFGLSGEKRRKVEIFVDGQFTHIPTLPGEEFADLKAGDVFRMFEDTGEPVVDSDGNTEFTVIEESYFDEVRNEYVAVHK